MDLRKLFVLSAIALATTDAPAQQAVLLDLSSSLRDETAAQSSWSPGLFQDAPLQAPDFGAKGSRRWSLHSGFTLQNSSNSLTEAGVGFEHFLLDDLSLEVQFSGAYVDQVGDDVAGMTMNLLFRWHFISEEAWSFYLEAGAGLIWTTDNVPQSGSHLNFTPQTALGISFEIKPETRIYASVGFHHLSNAGIFDTNPSRDSISFRLGISFPM